jgi:hypothetical protein
VQRWQRKIRTVDAAIVMQLNGDRSYRSSNATGAVLTAVTADKAAVTSFDQGPCGVVGRPRTHRPPPCCSLPSPAAPMLRHASTPP